MSEPRITELMEGHTERVTQASKHINTDHAFIHEGLAYKATLDIGNLNATNSVVYSMKTPANEYLHFKNFSLFGTGSSLKMEIRRGTTTNPLTVDNPDSGGIGADLIGPHNVNDFVGDEPETEFGLTPTFTGTEEGELWDVTIAPGSSTNQYASSSRTAISDNFEYVMKSDTYYTITIVNTSVADDAVDVGLEMFWYEETGA